MIGRSMDPTVFDFGPVVANNILNVSNDTKAITKKGVQAIRSGNLAITKSLAVARDTPATRDVAADCKRCE